MYYTFYKTYGGKIFFRYKKEGDPITRSKVVDFYQPTLYTSSNEDHGWRSIYGDPLKPINFDNIKSAKGFADSYKDVDGMEIHGNSNYANQFIIELFDGKEPDYNPKLIRIGILDIEVQSDGEFPDPTEVKWPINGITVYDSVEQANYSFMLKNKQGDLWREDLSPSYIKALNNNVFLFEDEESLIRSFLSHMNEHAYDVTSGWHSEGFDMPYIVNRCYYLFGEAYTAKMLSPFNKINIREILGNFGKKQQKIDIVGMPHLDYMELYKKHIFTPRESYKLDFIAHEELGENKINYEEASSLFELYENDFQKFTDYNIHDVNLIRLLEEKLGLFDLTYALAYYSMSNYEETLGTVKVWENLVAKHLFNNSQVPLFSGLSTEEREFDGAYVMEPKPGLYNWIMSIDLNSLYPMTEIQYNIGPETLIPESELPDELLDLRKKGTLNDLVSGSLDTSVLKKHDVCMTGNFRFYRKDKQSFFAAIKEDLYSKRKVFKKKMLDSQQKIADCKNEKEKESLESEEAKYSNMQMAMKLVLNAGYGAIANKHFLYYLVDNAEAITLSGQLVNKWTALRLDKFLSDKFSNENNNLAYGDTDSLYFSMEPLVKQLGDINNQKKVDLLDKFHEEVTQPEIDKMMVDLQDYMNAPLIRMVWSREVIASSAAWTSKKRYIMSVWDNEGVRYHDKPKLKIMGMESKKSSTPEWSRGFLEEVYEIALTQSEEVLHKRLEQIRGEFDKLDINQIAVPRGVNNIDKYYDPDVLCKSGTPKHVRGVLVHNKLVEDLGLRKVPKITDGSKIKFIELKEPNPTGHNVVAFDTYIPEDFKLEKYVDRGIIFDKSFMSPLRIFLNAIGWKEEEQVDLFSF